MTRRWRVLCVVLAVLGPLGAAASSWAGSRAQPPGHTLAVSEAGTGAGTVTSGDGAISCPPTCSHFYLSTAPVTITATPAAGSTFGGWSGACSGTSTTCTLPMASNQAATATFTKGGSPPPGPSCRLHLSSTRVLLAAPKSKPALRRKVGTLVLTFGCDQNVSATLTVKLVEKVAGAHPRRVTFHLVRHYTLRGGQTRKFTLSLWHGALRGLKHHYRETLTVSIQGSNVNGASGHGISARLKGVG